MTESDMSDASDDRVAVDVNALIRYAGALYAQYSATVDEPSSLYVDFVEWYRCHDFLVDREALCARARVEPSIADVFDRVYDNPHGGNPLLFNWARVCFCARGEPLARLRSVEAMVVLRWEDGRVGYMASVAPDTGDRDREWTDGEVLTALQKLFVGMGINVEEEGLDGLHEKAIDLGDRDATTRFAETLMRLPFPAEGGELGEKLDTIRRLLVTFLLQSWVAEDRMSDKMREERDARRAARPEGQPDALAESVARQIEAMAVEEDRRRTLEGIAARDPVLHRRVHAALARKV